MLPSFATGVSPHQQAVRACARDRQTAGGALASDGGQAMTVIGELLDWPDRAGRQRTAGVNGSDAYLVARHR